MSLDISKMTPEEVEAVAAGAFGSAKGMNLGPMVISSIFDVMLFGVMFQQYLNWWQYCKPTERPAIKYLTHYIMLASTAWTAMIISYVMHSFVYNFGHYTVFLEMTYFTAFASAGLGLSAFVQAFYVDRSFRLNNRSVPLLILLVTCILGEIAAVAALTVKATRIGSILSAGDALAEVRSWQCITLATDFLITTSLAAGLYRAKTGWSHTDALVKKLMLVTLETQLAPTLVMLGFVIEMSVSPSSSLGIFFDVMIPKAYTVGYLATLNTRVHLRRDAATSGTGSGKQTATNAFHLGSGRLQQATVQVDTETYIEAYQMADQKPGLNRTVDGSYEESIENLDYANNLSKQNLNRPSQNF